MSAFWYVGLFLIVGILILMDFLSDDEWRRKR